MLEESIEEEVDEGLDVDLATELLTVSPPYATEEDDRKDFNVQLSPLPTSLVREMKAFIEYRQSPFQRQRAGAQVVETTVAGDRANALRFLHYIKEHHDQSVPSLKLFASPRVGAWTQAWLAWLKDKGLMASTLASVRANPSRVLLVCKPPQHACALYVVHKRRHLVDNVRSRARGRQRFLPSRRASQFAASSGEHRQVRTPFPAPF